MDDTNDIDTMDFLAWVNSNSTNPEATNAAADLHKSLAHHVFDEEVMVTVLFGHDYDDLLGKIVNDWVRDLRADLPSLIEAYRAQRAP